MTSQDLYKKLQEMLPDFVFGDLNTDDHEFFLSHYKEFPDLIEEVDQATAVFDKLDKLEVKKVVSDRTRNLSVKVNQRRRGQMTERQRRTSFFAKFIAPSVSLALVAILMFTDVGKDMFLKDSHTSVEPKVEVAAEKPLEFVKYADLLAISDNGDMESVYEAVTGNETIVESEYASLSDYIEESIEEAIAATKTNVLLNSVGNYTSIQDDLSMLSEDDFQSIIEDLENEIDF